MQVDLNNLTDEDKRELQELTLRYRRGAAGAAAALEDDGEDPDKDPRVIRARRTVAILETFAEAVGVNLLSKTTAEQRARELLAARGVEEAQDYSAGDVVALANLIAENRQRDAEVWADGFAEAWRMYTPEKP